MTSNVQTVEKYKTLHRLKFAITLDDVDVIFFEFKDML